MAAPRVCALIRWTTVKKEDVFIFDYEQKVLTNSTNRGPIIYNLNIKNASAQEIKEGLLKKER